MARGGEVEGAIYHRHLAATVQGRKSLAVSWETPVLQASAMMEDRSAQDMQGPWGSLVTLLLGVQ